MTETIFGNKIIWSVIGFF